MAHGSKVITRQEVTGIDIYFSEFISEKQALNKAKPTLDNYTTSWKRYQQICRKDTVSEDDILSFINGIRETGKTNQTINHYLRDIRTFVNWCIGKGYMPACKVQLVEEEELVQDVYSDNDLLVMLQKPKYNDSFVEWRTWAMINLFLSGGMRASSALALQMQDIDFGSNMLIMKKAKNKKPIALPIGKELASALKLYIRMFRSDAKEDDYVFPSVYGGLLKTNGLYLAISDYNRNRGIDTVSTKKFRHNFGKAWVRSGGSLYKLQKVLGHKSIKMTQHYADIWGKDLQEGFEQHNLLDRIKTENSRRHAITRK